ncbi:hypothetical protein CBP36_20175 (plasmid) [Acidovorax carolinensis]|jgi:hypothetical protein|uniref:Uncharacterized protein n=1 Tax=Acidovorax carolinensis TaxID=553814 RepID=A0A240UJN2_9BURK|nr:hypothetical protein [Acidovorax carolinensis]ART57226.1 hypothetical protein CBP35_20155 [Acidovorax carolinensis]ART61283.1 hypothetical protein CBP36_20175 [Acidovorax carolinensis]
MYEVANNNSGMLEGRKPVSTEVEARAIAAALAKEHGHAYQVWGPAGMIDVVDSEAVAVSDCPDLSQRNEDTKRILGVFTKQVWGGRKGNDAIFVAEESFDATDAVLKLPHAAFIELQDNHESTDEIGRSVVDWCGPCEVCCVDSILEFFGVDSLEDVTPEMLGQ